MPANRRSTWFSLLWLFLCGAGGLGAGPALAQALRLADTVTVPGMPLSVEPHGYAEMGGIAYYVASDPAHGFELWRTDGTAAGTHLVVDLLPGPLSSMPGHLVAVGNALYFTALGDASHGLALWKSDGTAAGTLRVISTAEDGRFRYPTQLGDLGGRLIFTTNWGLSDSGAPYLWVSDGSASGTQPIRQLSYASDTTKLLPPVVTGGRAFLLRDSAERTLWTTDGTTAGTQSLWSGFIEDSPGLLVAWGGGVVFSAKNSQTYPVVKELWFSDGTPAGTHLLGAPPVRWPYTLTAQGPWLYLLGEPSVGGSGPALMRSDGTAAGTTTLHTFSPCGYRLLLQQPVGGRVIAGCGPTLVATDGAATEILGTLPLLLQRLRSSGGKAYFAATDQAAYGSMLVGVTDGTAAGTAVLRSGLSNRFYHGHASDAGDYTSPLSSLPIFAMSNGRMLFASFASDGDIGSSERPYTWVSDGTPAGTESLFDSARTRGGGPVGYTALGDTVFFGTRASAEPAAPYGPVSFGLWRTDGTGATQVLLLNGSGPCSTQPANDPCTTARLQSVAGKLYFVSRVGWSPLSLWVSDGSSAGTTLLTPAPLASASHPAPLGDRLVFIADDGAHGYEPWISDGSVSGTHLLADTCPGQCTHWPTWDASIPVFLNAGDPDAELTPSGARLFFIGGDSLWVTDGTEGGTLPLLSGVADVGSLVDVQGRVYFRANGSLWRSDGTQAGTQAVADAPGPTNLTAVGSRLFFQATDASHGRELWVSDGTAAGTRLVKDVRPGTRSSDISSPLAAGARLFFSASDGVSGRELWVSDGTEAGTWQVADVGPGPAAGLSEDQSLAWDGTRVFFAAYRPALGVELWASDGTQAGTFLVQDIAPGAMSSSPNELTVLGPRLYFTADDSRTGAEPWVLPLDLPMASVSEASVAEGDVGVSWLVFAVELLWPSGQAQSLSYATTGGTATPAVDYGAQAGALLFAPGQTQGSVSVPVFADRTREGDERLTLELGVAGQASLSARGLIVDDDASDVGASDVWVHERPAQMALAHVTLEAAADVDSSLWSYATEPGSAQAGLDYSPVAGQVTIGGDRPSVVVDVPILPDPQREGPETFRLRLTSNSGADTSATVTILDAWSRGDFDGDGQSDALFRNHDSGALQVWAMNGLSRAHVLATSPAGLADLQWRVAAVNDLDADGSADILWRHASSGKTVGWLMNGTTRVGGGYTSPDGVADLGWRLAASADLDADGDQDLVWQHGGSGRIVAWLMNGLAREQGAYLVPAGTGSAAWRVVAAADFDADGRSDLLFEHATTGRLVGWSLLGLVRRQGLFLSPDGYQDPGSGHAWRVQAVGDWNGDGQPDLLWRNVVDGRLRAWTMDGWRRRREVSVDPDTQTLEWDLVGPR